MPRPKKEKKISPYHIAAGVGGAALGIGAAALGHHLYRSRTTPPPSIIDNIAAIITGSSSSSSYYPSDSEYYSSSTYEDPSDSEYYSSSYYEDPSDSEYYSSSTYEDPSSYTYTYEEPSSYTYDDAPSSSSSETASFSGTSALPPPSPPPQRRPLSVFDYLPFRKAVVPESLPPNATQQQAEEYMLEMAHRLNSLREQGVSEEEIRRLQPSGSGSAPPPGETKYQRKNRETVQKVMRQLPKARQRELGPMFNAALNSISNADTEAKANDAANRFTRYAFPPSRSKR